MVGLVSTASIVVAFCRTVAHFFLHLRFLSFIVPHRLAYISTECDIAEVSNAFR